MFGIWDGVIHVTSCIPDVLVLLVVVLWTSRCLWFGVILSSSILSEIHVTSCIPDVLVLLVVVLWTPGWLWFGITLSSSILGEIHVTSCILTLHFCQGACRFGIWDGVILLFAKKFM